MAAPHLLEVTGYREARIDPFDFLHPNTPVPLVNRLNSVGRFLESVPAISQYVVSFFIHSAK
jgi:hypothetical protein